MKCMSKAGCLQLLLTLVTYGVSASNHQQPNIVIVLADDLGWRDLGYHGSEISTPILDSLAESGVKLENYYVQPVCAPTRAQLMTGRYQIRMAGMASSVSLRCPTGLPLEFPTLADMLRDNGYSTHMVGKWHLGFYKKEHLPTNRGFDSHYGFYSSAETYYTHLRDAALDFHDNRRPDWTEGYSTHLYTNRTIRIIRKHARKNAQKPLFLYLAFQAVHTPLEVPDEYLQPYGNIEDEERQKYAGMVSALDEAVGAIRASLQDNGLWDNTLLVFTTDNGGHPAKGASNWPLRGRKGELFEGGIHGVAFVTGPFLNRQDRVSRELMHVSDWFPTLVGLAGGDTSGMELDGHDVWPTISEGAASPRQDILHNYEPLHELKGSPMDGSPFDNRQRAALRFGRWKLLTGDVGLGHWTPPTESPHLGDSLSSDATDDSKNLWLFDIKNDPEEREDVSEENPLIVQMMLQKLAGYEEEAVDPVETVLDWEAFPGEGGVWEPWVN